MEKRLIGKTAIVTGANRGIGKAIAMRLAAEGADTVLCARDANLLKDAVNEIEGEGGHAAALAVDLRETDAAKKVVDFSIDTYRQIDIVVNNAGATKRGEFLELTDEDWKIIDQRVKRRQLASDDQVRALFDQYRHV